MPVKLLNILVHTCSGISGQGYTAIMHLLKNLNMGYSKYLSQGEEIVYKANIHWFIFFRPVILILAGLWLYGTSSAVIHYAGIALMLLGAFDLIRRLIEKAGTLYAVTNKKVILKSGIIQRDALELVLGKCEGIRISQGIAGRLLGYGSIVVTTGGATNTFRYVSSPMAFRRAINDQLS